MTLLGATHCIECGSKLKSNEYIKCKQCEEEQLRQYEEKDLEDKVSRIFNNMNEYELKALEEFIHKIGKEYKKKEIETQTKRLEKELEK